MSESPHAIDAHKTGAEQTQEEARVPLYVDLDDTLVRTDMLWESIFRLVRQRPLAALRLPFWVLKGKAGFKREIVDRIELDPTSLPYREEVLTLIRDARAQERRVVLATATDERIARPIAEHLGLFDEVLASDGTRNVKSSNKLAVIRAQVGNAPFDYVGDTNADLPIWREAREKIAVAPSRSLVAKIREFGEPQIIDDSGPARWKVALEAMRPYQWVRNLLLFVPLVLSRQFMDIGLVWLSCLAFLSFCLAASAASIFNDLVHLESDRRHTTNYRRPFASGSLSIRGGVLLMGLLGPLSFTLAAMTGAVTFVAMLGVFLVTATAYSYLKEKLVLHVLILAALDTLRVVAGGEAVAMEISPWLIAACFSLFVSLTLVKQYFCRADSSSDVQATP
ncbi:MAG: UbiA family prenyltransferase [Pirellulales bacterium]|nr:UbiA family prenyltransferase [Pirellulales bacterium]